MCPSGGVVRWICGSGQVDKGMGVCPNLGWGDQAEPSDGHIVSSEDALLVGQVGWVLGT